MCADLVPQLLLPNALCLSLHQLLLQDGGANLLLLAPLERIAAAHKASAAQVAIAWLLAKGEDIVPIPGTKRRKYLEENCGAVELKLSAEDIAALDAAFPAEETAGTRYPEKQLKALGI